MQRLITILGPTASGKTSLAAALAHRLDGEIISADSRQVYRGMDIGTGKDLVDYVVEGRKVPYHLIDIREPGTKYNLFQYQQDFHNAYQDILRRGKQPILCGGTGLYIESVLKGYQLSPVPQNETLRRQLENKSLEELTPMLEELKRKTGSHMHNRSDVDTAQRAIRAIEIETYNLEHPLPERELPPVPSLIIGTPDGRRLPAACAKGWSRAWWKRFGACSKGEYPQRIYFITGWNTSMLPSMSWDGAPIRRCFGTWR